MNNEIITRKTMNIPGGLSREAVNILVSQLMGEAVEISDEQFNEYNNNEKHQVKKIIEPWFSELQKVGTRNSLEKLDELIDLGKFIYSYRHAKDEKMEILQCDEDMVPDFVVKYKGHSVGIEHTRLIDTDVVEEVSKLDQAVQKAREIVLKTEPTLTGLCNIYVSSSSPLMHDKNFNNFSKDQKKAFKERRDNLPLEIARYILSLMQKGTVVKPSFIENVIIADWPSLEFVLRERYVAKELTKEKIYSIIQQKEAKISSYLEAKSLQHCWLLIVMGGVKSSSSFAIAAENVPKSQTKFDQLFIFHNFTREIYPSYPTENLERYLFIPAE